MSHIKCCMGASNGGCGRRVIEVVQPVVDAPLPVHPHTLIIYLTPTLLMLDH